MARHVNASSSARPTAGSTAHIISTPLREWGTVALGSGTYRAPRTERMMKICAPAQHATDVQNNPLAKYEGMCDTG